MNNTFNIQNYCEKRLIRHTLKRDITFLRELADRDMLYVKELTPLMSSIQSRLGAHRESDYKVAIADIEVRWRAFRDELRASIMSIAHNPHYPTIRLYAQMYVSSPCLPGYLLPEICHRLGISSDGDVNTLIMRVGQEMKTIQAGL